MGLRRAYCVRVARLFGLVGLQLVSLAHADRGELAIWEVSLLAGVAANSSNISSAEADEFDLAISSGKSFALIVNHLQEYRGDDRLHYEFYAAKTDSQLDIHTLADGLRTVVNMPVYYLHVGGTYELAQAGTTLAPYVGATAGLARFEPDGLDALNKFSMAIAGGFRWPITSSVGLRLDARALATFLGPQASIFCADGCVARVNSDIWWQYEVMAGLVFVF
jgi:hypothetical protein